MVEYVEPLKISIEQASELLDLKWGEKSDTFKIVDEVNGRNRRWTRTNQLIFKKQGDPGTYCLFWEEGLTECQDLDEHDRFNTAGNVVECPAVHVEYVKVPRYTICKKPSDT